MAFERASPSTVATKEPAGDWYGMAKAFLFIAASGFVLLVIALAWMVFKYQRTRSLRGPGKK